MEVIKVPVLEIEECFNSCTSRDKSPNCQCKREN